MLRLALCLFLMAGILLNSVSTFAQQTNAIAPEASIEQLTAAFEAEMIAYAATHTDAELRQYAQWRVDQITAQAIGATVNQLTVVGTPLQTMVGPTQDLDPFSFNLAEPWNEPFDICIQGRNEECRRIFHAAVLQSAATSTAIMAGCVAISTGTALAICIALAVAAHAAGVAAASQNYQACLVRAQTDCRLQYPPKKTPVKPGGN